MTNQALREMIDKQEITRVLHQYCKALDCMDLPSLAALFTADCHVDYGPDEAFQSHGSASLQESLHRMWRYSRTSHHLSNIDIRFSGRDEASSNSYVFAWHERPDGEIATVLGQYDDRLVRDGDTWRISARRMLMNGADAGFRVNINPAERQLPPKDWTPPSFD